MKFKIGQLMAFKNDKSYNNGILLVIEAKEDVPKFKWILNPQRYIGPCIGLDRGYVERYLYVVSNKEE